MAPKGSGSTVRCSVFGVGVALLKEVHSFGGGLWDLTYTQATPSVWDYFLLPAQELSATPKTPSLPVHHYCPLW